MRTVPPLFPENEFPAAIEMSLFPLTETDPAGTCPKLVEIDSEPEND